MNFLESILNIEKLGPNKYKKLIICMFSLMAVTLILGFLFLFGVERFPFLIIFGGLSLAITLGLVSVLIALYMIAWNLHMFRHHFELWRVLFRSSVKERVKASKAIGSLKDPYIDKISIWLNKAGLLFLGIWLIVFLLTVIIVLILDHL